MEKLLSAKSSCFLRSLMVISALTSVDRSTIRLGLPMHARAKRFWNPKLQPAGTDRSIQSSLYLCACNAGKKLLGKRVIPAQALRLTLLLVFSHSIESGCACRSARNLEVYRQLTSQWASFVRKLAGQTRAKVVADGVVHSRSLHYCGSRRHGAHAVERGGYLRSTRARNALRVRAGRCCMPGCMHPHSLRSTRLFSELPDPKAAETSAVKASVRCPSLAGPGTTVLKRTRLTGNCCVIRALLWTAIQRRYCTRRSQKQWRQLSQWLWVLRGARLCGRNP